MEITPESLTLFFFVVVGAKLKIEIFEIPVKSKFLDLFFRKRYFHSRLLGYGDFLPPHEIQS